MDDTTDELLQKARTIYDGATAECSGPGHREDRDHIRLTAMWHILGAILHQMQSDVDATNARRRRHSSPSPVSTGDRR